MNQQPEHEAHETRVQGMTAVARLSACLLNRMELHWRRPRMHPGGTAFHTFFAATRLSARSNRRRCLERYWCTQRCKQNLLYRAALSHLRHAACMYTQGPVTLLWMDGWMDGWTNGWMDGCPPRQASALTCDIGARSWRRLLHACCEGPQCGDDWRNWR